MKDNYLRGLGGCRDSGKGVSKEKIFDDRVALMEKYCMDENKIMDEIFQFEEKLSRFSEESIRLIERINAIEDERLRIS